MKKFTLNSLFMTAVLCMCALLVNRLSAQTVITSGTVYTSGTSFSVPNGYKVVKVEAWGGGGGGERNSTQCGDGGGGGGYACINLDGSLVGPVTLNVTIGGGGSGASGENALGCPGGTTTVSYGGTWMVQATGGRGGGHTGTYSCGGDASYYGRAGGTGSVNTAFSGYSSQVTNNGGSGGSGKSWGLGDAALRAGGGGGAAGSASGVGASGADGYASGLNGTGGDGGTGTSGAGSGGKGGDNGFSGHDGDNGTAPGGGGGGCPNKKLASNASPGSGAGGGVRFTLAAACDANAGEIKVETWICTSGTPSDTSIVISSKTDASSTTSGRYLWQSSSDNSSWTNIDGAPNDKYYTVTATGYYRRGYAVNGCTTVYTNSVQVTRPSDIDPGMVKDAGGGSTTNICSGGNVSVNLVANTTYPNITWQKSTDGNNWTPAGSVTPFAINGITTTTYVRYVVNYTSTCEVPSNNHYTFNVWENPVVNNIAEPTDKCPGKTSYEVTADVTAGSNSTLTYHWKGATGSGNVGTVAATLPNCNTTYYDTLYVTDGNNCISNTKTNTFTTENPTWSLGTISSVTAVSDGSCNFSVPSLTTLTDTVNSALNSTCGNAATLSNLSLAVGDPITATTTMTVTATDMCGVAHTGIEITVVKPDAPTVNITTAEQYLCPGETTKLTTNVTAEEPTYEWTPASLGTEDTAITVAYTTEDVNVHPDTFKVKVTDKYGCEKIGEIVIYTTPKAYIANQEHTVCTPNSVTFAAATGDKIPAASTTIGTNTFTSTTTYSWTIASNTGVTGASAATDQANFTTGTLTNGELTTQTVIYSVTPTTVTSFSGSEVTSCDGDAFTVTVNVKPTITTTGAIDPFDDADVIITLWYGACDTLYYVNAPAYTNNTDLTDVLSNNKATVNEGTTLLGRIAPGEYTIIWTVTDECGNHVDFPKKYIVRYPNCGDADPNYTEPYIAVDADGNEYHTVRIGCECWTASNLKTVTGAPNSMVYKCNDYPNETENEEKYGRLYTWYTAVNVPEGDNTTEPTVTTAAYSTYPYVHGICPTGWAIPSTDNFNSMVNIAGGVNAVKSSSNLYWLPGAEGNDASGFGARGAGYYDSSAERFMNLMGETYFWTYETSSSYGGKCAVISYYCPELLIQDKLKGMGYSIRCIRRENP